MSIHEEQEQRIMMIASHLVIEIVKTCGQPAELDDNGMILDATMPEIMSEAAFYVALALERMLEEQTKGR